MTPVAPGGVLSDRIVWLDSGATPTMGSDPVLLSTGAGHFVAVFTDFSVGTAGDEVDIVARTVDTTGSSASRADAGALAAGSAGPLVVVNTRTVGEQSRADAIATSGGQIVVAWTDYSDSATGPDLRYQLFDASLAKVGGEVLLAGTAASEDDVALSTFGRGWAAAWRAAIDGLETIHVAALGREWTIGSPFLGGPALDRPAIAELDATHLLVGYEEGIADEMGIANATRLRLAVVDTSVPPDPAGGQAGITITDLAPRMAADGGSGLVSLDQVNLAGANGRVYATWRSLATGTDPNGDELWLKEIAWNGSVLDLEHGRNPASAHGGSSQGRSNAPRNGTSRPIPCVGRGRRRRMPRTRAAIGR